MGAQPAGEGAVDNLERTALDAAIQGQLAVALYLGDGRQFGQRRPLRLRGSRRWQGLEKRQGQTSND